MEGMHKRKMAYAILLLQVVCVAHAMSWSSYSEACSPKTLALHHQSLEERCCDV